MKRFLLLLIASALLLPAAAQRQAENLDRGLVAINKGSRQVFLSWRFLATDPDSICFNLYRSIGSKNAKKTKLNANPISGATNYVWTIPSGTTAFEVATYYFVAPVIGGEEGEIDGWWNVPAKKDANRIVKDFNYQALPAGWPKMIMKFCWVGDLDGDGRYDFVIDRIGGGTTDEEEEAGTTSQTTPSLLEAYTSEGKFLWRMSMGYNVAISSGHADEVTVYDMDGDGKAEVMMCVSEGTRFADSTLITNADGTVHDYSTTAGSAPQWVAIVNGQTGAFITKAELPHAKAIATQRSDKWKNISGHFIINYLDGIHPSLVYQYKNRQTSGNFTGAYAAWRLIDGQLVVQYAELFARNNQEYESHQVRGGDVDGDGKDETVEISYVIDDNGKELCEAKGLAHGDRHCLADIDPDHPGLEQFFIQQTSTLGMGTWDVQTGELLSTHYMASAVDVGRGMCAAMDTRKRGMQYFSTMNSYQLYDCNGNIITNAKGTFPAEALWWGPKLSRYMVQGIGGSGYNVAFSQYNESTQQLERVTPNFYMEGGDYYLKSIYGGRAAFWGDILGDWREEMVLPRRDTTGFAVVSTWDVTDHRQYCLMQNPGYRVQTTARGYYQTPDVDFYMAADMPLPPIAPVQTADVYLTSESSLQASQIDSLTAMLDIRNPNSVIALNEKVAPGRLWLMNPKGHDYVIDGTGSITGNGDVMKSMQGTVTLKGNHTYTGQTRISEGSLYIDGNLVSPVWVNARGVIGGTGCLKGGVTLETGLNAYGGRIEPGFGQKLGTLTIEGDLQLVGRNNLAFDIDQKQTGKNDTLAIKGSFLLKGSNNALVFNLLTDMESDTLTLMTYDSTNVKISDFKVYGLDGIPYTLLIDTHSLKLVVEKPRTAAKIQWTGKVNGTWDFKTANFEYQGKDVLFVPGDTVCFDDSAVTTSITLSEAMPVGGLIFDNTVAYSLGGSGSISGEGGLTKTGTGKLTINLKANTFTGKVDFADGTLAVASLNNGGVASSIGASPKAAANWVMKNAVLVPMGQMSTDRAMNITGSLTVNTIASNYSVLISGNIGGKGTKLYARGSGTLNLSGTNTFDSVFVYGGTIACGSVAANKTAFGSAPITMYGGKLQMQESNSTSNTGPWTNTIIVPEGANVQWNLPKRWNFTNKLLGNGKITINSPYVRTYFRGDWSAFAGTITVTGQDFIIDNNYGFGKATLYLSDGVNAYHKSGSATFAIGALAGVSGATLTGDNMHWQIGGRNADSQYGGVISGSNGRLTKQGTGRLTLGGANTYTGATIVSAGTLWTTNTSGSATGTGVVTVRSGAVLGGKGIVSGNVTVNSGGILSTEDKGYGTLTCSGNLTLQQGSVLSMEVNSASQKCDVVKVGRNLTIADTLSLTDLASSSAFASHQQYELFKVSGTVTGGFVSILPELPSPLQWDQTLLSTEGKLQIVNPEGLSDVQNGKTVVNIEYFDLLGNRLSEGQNCSGILICRKTFTDGTVETVKLQK